MTNFRNEFARRWRSFALLSVMLLAVPVLAIACPSSDDTTVTPDPEPPVVTPDPVVMPDPDPVPSGDPVTFNIAIPDNVTANNVWAWLGTDATAYNFAVFLNRYPSLTGLSDVRYEWVPSISDGLPEPVMMEVGEGYTYTVEVSVRDGLTWSDGSPLDANDVAFTANTVIDLGLSGNWASSYDSAYLHNVEAVDDLTVKFYFSQEPGLAIWQYGTAQSAIVSDEYWGPVVQMLLDEVGDNGMPTQEVRDRLFAHDSLDPDNLEPTIGPVLVLAREEDAFVSLERNDDFIFAGDGFRQYSDGTYQDVRADGTTTEYFGDATGDVDLEVTYDQQPDTTIFTSYQNQNTAVLALRSGDVDYFLSPLGLSTGLRAQLADADDLTIFSNASNGFRYLSFNTRREPFNDLAFRQAFATLVDIELIATNVLQGAVTPIYTVVPQGNVFWHNPDTPRYGFNEVDGELVSMTREERINEAVRILTDAGYSWTTVPTWDATNRSVSNGEGFAGPDGELIEEFEIISPGHGYDSFRATMAVIIEQWLNQAGIPARANLTGFNEIVGKLTDGNLDYDIWILGWGLGIYPDHVALFFQESQINSAEKPGGFNRAGWVNEEFEQLVVDFNAEKDIEEARKLNFRMQEIVATELPYLTLFSTQIVEAYRPSAFQFEYTEVLDGVQNLFSGSTGPLANVKFAE